MRAELADLCQHMAVPEPLLPLVDAGLAFATLDEVMPQGWLFWGVRRASPTQQGDPFLGDDSKRWSAAAAPTEGQESVAAFGDSGVNAVWALVDALRERG